MTHKNQDIGSANLVPHRLDSLYEIFHENSKITPANEALLGLRIGRLLRSPEMVALMARGYNRFPHLPRVQLSRDMPALECHLDEAILRRRSVRDFAKDPLSLSELNQLLYLSNGITGGYEFGDGQVQWTRAAPSGGGLYPIEAYVIAQRVRELDPGVYHYNVPDHALEQMPKPPNLKTQLETVSHYQEILTGAAALAVLTAVFPRTTLKYGDRGYRFALLDAGHLAENLLLVATALGLGAVPIGGFRDDQLSAVVGANGVDEAAVYLIALGRPTQQALDIAEQQRQYVLKRGVEK